MVSKQSQEQKRPGSEVNSKGKAELPGVKDSLGMGRRNRAEALLSHQPPNLK